MDAANINPTWGYKPDGSAEIFDLSAGESLPDGWFASPACITNPDLATAEALSARAAGRDYVAPVADPVSGFRLDGETDVPGTAADPDALAAARAEIDRLQGIITAGTTENADLIAQIEGAERAIDAAAAEVAGLRTELARAGEDRATALASVEALTADLATARADLEALTAPAPAEPKAPAKAK